MRALFYVGNKILKKIILKAILEIIFNAMTFDKDFWLKGLAISAYVFILTDIILLIVSLVNYLERPYFCMAEKSDPSNAQGTI